MEQDRVHEASVNPILVWSEIRSSGQNRQRPRQILRFFASLRMMPGQANRGLLDQFLGGLDGA